MIMPTTTDGQKPIAIAVKPKICDSAPRHNITIQPFSRKIGTKKISTSKITAVIPIMFRFLPPQGLQPLGLTLWSREHRTPDL